VRLAARIVKPAASKQTSRWREIYNPYQPREPAKLFTLSVEGALQWWLGDWWCYGEPAYGERREAWAKKQFGDLAFQTIRNYGWIANKVKASPRWDVLASSTMNMWLLCLNPSNANGSHAPSKVDGSLP
jgi:hypothetical protein